MQKLILYTTEGCHLCDQAAQLLQQAEAALELELVDIASSEALVECYGIRIPVIKKTATEAELGWPFDAAMLHQFLAEG